VTLVLDSSIALAWIYADEGTERIQQLVERVIVAGAYVPTLWRLEVANSLLMAVRKGRIDAAFRDAALRDLAALNIMADLQTDVFAWSSTLRLAEKHRLTVYDAAYLELALRRVLPLASLDKELRAAGDATGVTLLGV
jgi:predicted nucleic acid-binding protein